MATSLLLMSLLESPEWDAFLQLTSRIRKRKMAFIFMLFSYYSITMLVVCFYIKFYYLCGSYCQFFVFLLLFLRYTDANKNHIKKFRKLYHFCFIFFSTLISPPEILNQICISLSIIFSYEILVYYSILKKLFKKF